MNLLEYYADPNSGAWAEVGYRPYPLGPPAIHHFDELPTSSVRGISDRYDVVVVGSGAGGGVAARVLAGAGASVLVVERGHRIERDAPGMTHLRNHRLPVYGDGTTPTGHPRVVIDADGAEVAVEPDDLRYLNNAVAVGGGTRFFGAQAWRFHPDDFHMASKYGTPEGSALADWPIGYDELAPFYDRVEWEAGVAGDAASNVWPRTRGYPMEPFPLSTEGTRLADGARALGWNTTRVPLLVNTVPRDGRPACIRCGFCVGFPCPVDAKNGSETTVLRRAIGAGAVLVTGTQVVRITDGGTVELACPDGELRTVHAGYIVLAAGAVETPRLLMVSQLGNDWLGDCLQGHTYAGAFGVFDDVVVDGLGPGPSIATLEFAHDNEGVVGGGMLANDFVKLPAMFAVWGVPPGAPRNEDALRELIAQNYRRTAHVMGPAQEIPTRTARVRLASSVTDAHGVPVARLEGVQHRDDLRSAALLARRAEEWIEAAGATRTWHFASTVPTLSGGQHGAGTARMAESPSLGATTPWGRVWGCDRIYVADGSVHVTNGCVNPVLTIMALAWRTADHLAVKG